jgi:hypothetical protein
MAQIKRFVSPVPVTKDFKNKMASSYGLELLLFFYEVGNLFSQRVPTLPTDI